MTSADRPPAIAWAWSRFLLGAVFAVPAAVVAPFAPTAGLALAVGVLPAAAFGLPPTRRARASLPLVGALSGAGLIVGSLLTQVPVVAVPALLAFAVIASLLAGRGRLGLMGLVLVLPMVGIGLSFVDVSTTVLMGVCIVAGSVYAWLVSLAWPETPAVAPAPPAPVLPTRARLIYGILLGLAAAIAATIGYLLDLEHVGWATGSALLVMRPARDQLVLRSVGRSASVLVGAFAAAAFAVLDPQEAGLAVLITVAVAALTATRGSRWYITPGFTTLIALTLVIGTSEASPGERFLERAGETLLGVGLAVLFGGVIPALLRRTRPAPAE